MSTMTRTQTEWEVLGKRVLDREWKLLIGGELRAAAQGKTYEVYNPATEELLAQVPFAQEEDVEDAVNKAEKAFHEWRKLTPLERSRYLRRLVEALKKRADEFAVLDAIDCGIPITMMLKDVQVGLELMEYISGLSFEVKGQTYPTGDGGWHLSWRQPYGVVARIIPFNHPFAGACHNISGPLMAGNTVILKVADQAPLSSLLFGEICQEIFPPGVVNILSGNGSITGEAIVKHPKIKRIGFIGSVPTGKTIIRSSAETAVKHISLELGGKNAMLVFPDVDLDEAVDGAVRGMSFGFQGQSCSSTSRLFLHESIHDQFLEKLKRRIEKIKVGLPLDPQSEMGCIVSKEQYEKVRYYIDSALAEGAQLLTGGKRPEGTQFEKGYFIQPTVFYHVNRSMKIFNEEIFGPVLAVIKWNDLEDVVEQINQVEYGLSAAVWTKDIDRALEMVERIEAGFIWVNGNAVHALGVPFQGHKNSGVGSEKSLEEILSYTQIKTVNIIKSN